MKREYNKPTLNIEEISLINAVTVSSTGTFGDIVIDENDKSVVEWEEFF